MTISDYILNDEKLKHLDFETVYRTIFRLITSGKMESGDYNVYLLQSEPTGEKGG